MGGILLFRGSFLEGSESATERFLPWRQPQGCQEKTALCLPFKGVSPQSCGEKGKTGPKTGTPRQAARGDRLGSWLRGLGRIAAPL